MFELSWFQGIVFSSQSTQMLTGAQQWSLADFLEARWHFPSFFLWHESAPCCSQHLNQWRKRKERSRIPVGHQQFTYHTYIPLQWLPKQPQSTCDAPVFMPSTSIENKETKHQARTAQTPVTEAPTPVYPSAVAFTIPLFSELAAGRHKQSWEWISSMTYQFPLRHRAPHPSVPRICPGHTKLQPELQQKHFWSIPQNTTKVMVPSSMAFTKRQSHKAFTVIPWTKGAVMANPCSKGAFLEIKPIKALKTKQRHLPCQVLWDCLSQSGHAAALSASGNFPGGWGCSAAVR